MKSRTLASLLASGLFVVLVVLAVAAPVPYVVYRPGPTFDVLAEDRGDEIVEVEGHEAYRDDGQIRFTTVAVTGAEQRLNIFDAVTAWVSRNDAVYPREVVYPDDQSAADAERESSVQMVSSQDAAVANAMRATGATVPAVTEVLDVARGSGADGALAVRDQLISVAGTPITTSQDVVDAVSKVEPGDRVRVTVRREGKRLTVPVRTKPSPDDPTKALLGIVVGLGYDFPYSVQVDISDNIGGPSAGLMFSLAVYDTLTPGSLTQGHVVAGTGTVDDSGTVGPIGGIQQKIIGASRSDAELFFVPKGNCDAATAAPAPEGMRLVEATTMEGALDSLRAWTTDEDAELPTCG